MTFTHDTEVALRTAAALVNTEPTPGRQDTLSSLGELADFVDQWGWTGTMARDGDELAAVRALRPRLRAAWLATSDAELAELVNAFLREGRALPQVVAHGDYGWHIHATPSRAPLAVRMLVEAAMALVDVVRAGERTRLRVCAARDCPDVLVDLSRNRSRRYCEGGCGNRLAAAAYRSRRAD